MSQVSVVHALPSSHVTATAVWMHPVLGSQLSAVHATLSLQSVVMPMHVPPLHTSPPVQVLPSLQAVPLATGAGKQVPVAVWQVDFTHAVSLDVSHTTMVAALVLQVPPWHVGLPLQRSPSSWHWLSVWQKQLLKGAVHAPFWQIEIGVHGSPSSHVLGGKLPRFVCTQPEPALQLSVVHGFWSSQLTWPTRQFPAKH